MFLDACITTCIYLHMPIYRNVSDIMIYTGKKFGPLQFSLFCMYWSACKSVIIFKHYLVELLIATFIHKLFLLFVYSSDSIRCWKELYVAANSPVGVVRLSRHRIDVCFSSYITWKSSNYEELHRKNISFKIIIYFSVCHGNDIILDKLGYQKLLEWIEVFFLVCNWNYFLFNTFFYMYIIDKKI